MIDSKFILLFAANVLTVWWYSMFHNNSSCQK